MTYLLTLGNLKVAFAFVPGVGVWQVPEAQRPLQQVRPEAQRPTFMRLINLWSNTEDVSLLHLEVVITDFPLCVFWAKEAIPGGLAVPDFTIGTPVTTHEATGALADAQSGRPTLLTNPSFSLSYWMKLIKLFSTRNSIKFKTCLKEMRNKELFLYYHMSGLWNNHKLIQGQRKAFSQNDTCISKW